MNYRSLPISERIELVEDIWDSIAEETASLLQLSVEERAELHPSLGCTPSRSFKQHPWEQVRAALFLMGAWGMWQKRLKYGYSRCINCLRCYAKYSKLRLELCKVWSIAVGLARFNVYTIIPG